MCVCECVCVVCVCVCVCVCVPSEGATSVLEAVQASEAILKSVETDVEVASHNLREQLTEAGRRGLGTDIVEEFEPRVHSAVSDVHAQKGALVIALESGKQVVDGYQQETEEKELKRYSDISV